MLLAAAGCGHASIASAQAGRLPAYFVDQLVVGPELDRPVGMAFLPDGRLLFVELKTAKIRMIVADALAVVDPLGVVDSVDAGTEEEGLLGIAVDPRWPAHPYVYVMYDALDERERISRFRASGDLAVPASGRLTIDPASRFDLLRDIPDERPYHNGGTLRFGLDGMLYVGLADDGLACTAQDSSSLRGVMLRMDVSRLPDGPGVADKAALVPVDNPWAASPSPNQRLVWSLGLRNPFRFDVDRVTGDLFVGDVGWSTQEEIDVIDGPALNFGWPFYEGAVGREEVHAGACERPAPAEVRAPIHVYARPAGRGTVAVIGGVVLRPSRGAGGGFPTEYEGDYLFADFYGGFVRRLENVGGAWSHAPPTLGQPSPVDWADGFQQVTEFACGPDGALWYARMSVLYQERSGSIRRIVYQPPLGAASVPEARVRFAPPSPSPARGEVRFSYALAGEARVELAIFDALGRRVRGLVRAAPRGPGEHAVTWDARDERGHAVPPGSYVARLVVDGVLHERKVSIIR